MNAKDRDAVEKLVGQLDDIKNALETFRDQEQEKFDNMSEGLQQSEKGQAIETAASNLDSATADLDSVISNLNDVVAG